MMKKINPRQLRQETLNDNVTPIRGARLLKSDVYPQTTSLAEEEQLRVSEIRRRTIQREPSL